MAINIRNNQSIECIKIKTNQGKKELKISQYADDGTLILHDSNHIFNALDEILAFSNAAGPKLNTEKTEGLWISSMKFCKEKPADIKWQQIIRYLGVYLGHDKPQCYRHNWLSKLEKLQKILDNWRKRHTTIFGRTIIIKSLALPTSVLPCYQYHRT